MYFYYNKCSVSRQYFQFSAQFDKQFINWVSNMSLRQQLISPHEQVSPEHLQFLICDFQLNCILPFEQHSILAQNGNDVKIDEMPCRTNCSIARYAVDEDGVNHAACRLKWLEIA